MNKQQEIYCNRKLKRLCVTCGCDISMDLLPKPKARCKKCLEKERVTQRSKPRNWKERYRSRKNEGARHKKRMGVYGAHLYKWLQLNNYPADIKLQVLCANCNWSKRLNGGVCEHKTEQCNVVAASQEVGAMGAEA